MQMSLWVATPGGTPSFTHITHPLLQPTMSKTPEAVSMCMFPPGVAPAGLFNKLLPLQEKMNAGLEQLLTNRATRDLCHKRVGLKCGNGSLPEQCPGH